MDVIIQLPQRVSAYPTPEDAKQAVRDCWSADADGIVLSEFEKNLVRFGDNPAREAVLNQTIDEILDEADNNGKRVYITALRYTKHNYGVSQYYELPAQQTKFAKVILTELLLKPGEIRTLGPFTGIPVSELCQIVLKVNYGSVTVQVGHQQNEIVSKYNDLTGCPRLFQLQFICVDTGAVWITFRNAGEIQASVNLNSITAAPRELPWVRTFDPDFHLPYPKPRYYGIPKFWREQPQNVDKPHVCGFFECRDPNTADPHALLAMTDHLFALVGDFFDHPAVRRGGFRITADEASNWGQNNALNIWNSSGAQFAYGLAYLIAAVNREYPDARLLVDGDMLSNSHNGITASRTNNRKNSGMAEARGVLALLLAGNPDTNLELIPWNEDKWIRGTRTWKLTNDILQLSAIDGAVIMPGYYPDQNSLMNFVEAVREAREAAPGGVNIPAVLYFSWSPGEFSVQKMTSRIRTLKSELEP